MAEQQRLTDFIDGERDAKKGVPADKNRSEDYQRGYGYKYAALEMQSHQGGKK